MSNSRGIIKSSKSIVGEGESRRVQLQLNVSTHSIQLQDETPVPSELEEISLPKAGPQRKLQVKSSLPTSKEGKDSCKNIKTRSCFKKEHSRVEDDEEGEIKSAKSIKFKAKVDNVFIYSLADRGGNGEKEGPKKSIRRKDKVD